MDTISSELRRVLSISLHSKGFGFVVFEHVARPLDWGVKRLRGKERKEALRKVEGLIDMYRPDVLLVEPPETPRRSARVQALAAAIVEQGRLRDITIVTVSRDAIRAQFAPFGATTKHAIAAEIARHFPALAPRLPAPRKPWQSEDARMAIFGACALAQLWLAKPASDHPAVDKTVP